VSLVKQNRNFRIHDDGHEDLFEELLAVLNGGAINLKQWFVQFLSESLGELCLAQTLCSIEHKEGSNFGCLVSLKIERQLLLDVTLAN
jgi:hypothetical protein